jgi:hypothetical protein
MYHMHKVVSRTWIRPLGLALLATAMAGLSAVGESADGTDPLPLRRVLLTPERLTAELKRLREGVLVQMTQAEFDQRLRRAAQAAERTAPRLAEARYNASLKEENGSAALVGAGQWKVIHSGPGSGLLLLQPFNLALRQARFENREALVADFDGRGLALLVDSPGEQAVAVEWSARGEIRPEGIQFDLRTPACPAAVFEIDVSEGRSVAALNGAAVSGPHPAETADRRLWRVYGGSRSQINILIRPPAAACLQPLRLVRQKTTQKLSPEGLEAVYELAVEALHPGVRELVCEYDPELRPRDISAPGLESWEPVPGTAGQPGRVTVRLAEPLREGTVVIACMAPLGPVSQGPSNTTPVGVVWRSPGLRLQGAAPRGETLEIWFNPDVRVDDWRPGGFTLRGAGEKEAERSDESPGGSLWQRVSLVGGGLEPVDRPSAHLRVRGAEFRTRLLEWWQIDATGMTLTLQVAYDVSYGRLFQLPVLLPVDWEPERVEVSPAGLVRDWSIRPGPQGTLLRVDLQRPLEARETRAESGLTRLRPPGATGEDSGPAHPGAPRAELPRREATRAPTLTVQLRPIRPGNIAGRDLPFPKALPVGARLVEGALAVDLDDQVWRASMSTAAEPATPEDEGPWGKRLVDYYYRFLGNSLHGTLHLEPQRPRLRVRCQSEVALSRPWWAAGTAGVPVAQTRLLLEAEAGNIPAIELDFSAAPEGPWAWAEERSSAMNDRTAGRGPVRSAERLPGEEASAAAVLAARNPLDVACFLAARPRGQRWRLSLMRPLRPREPLRLVAALPLGLGAAGREVPLVVVPSAERMEGEVTLPAASGKRAEVLVIGLRETATQRDVQSRRTFRYGPSGGSLVLRDPLGAAATVERAALTTSLGGDGLLRHSFRFELTHWPPGTLPLRLPSGADVRAVQVDGRWLDRLLPGAAVAEDTALPVLALTVPAVSDGTDVPHRFEIVYTTPAESGEAGLLPWRCLEAQVPELPVAPTAFRRTWRLPPDVFPLAESRYLRLPGGAAPDATFGRAPTDLFVPPGLPRPWPEPAGDVEVLRALHNAARGLRLGGGPSLPLCEVVDRIAFRFLRDQAALVLDTAALREAGLTAETPVPLTGDGRRPPWEDLGLATVPCREVVLLTTHRQLTAWRGSGDARLQALLPSPPGGSEAGVPLPEAVVQRSTAAAAQGQDSSGRFISSLCWLRPGAEAARGAGSSSGWPRLVSTPDSDPPNWTEWEPIAGADDSSLVVLNRGPVSAVGLVLTALLALLGWRLRRLPWRLRLTLLLAGLGLAGFGLMTLPGVLHDLAWWPLAGGCVLGLIWYLRAAARSSLGRHLTQGAGRQMLAGAAVLLLVGGGTWMAQAPSGTTPATIYLLPDRLSVLVPVEVLERLDAAAEIPAAGGAVLLAGSYDGKIEGSTAEFTAVFSMHCLGEKPAELALPLDGVQLVGDVWLDGARANPVTRPAPQVGYALTVKGRGRHKVELRFRVPLLRGSTGQSVQFTAVPLVQSRLVLHLPAGTGSTQVPAAHGACVEVAEGPGRRLEADLGRLSTPLTIRWEAEARSGPVPIQYRAAYLWDLRGDASTLQVLLHCRVPGGAAPALAVAVPAELDVHAASLHRTLAVPAAPVRLRDLHMDRAANPPLLRLDFAAPIAGEFDVLLELVPKGPLPAEFTLPLPVPRAEPLPGGQHLAYRTTGLEAKPISLQSVTGIVASEFAPFWPSSSRPEVRSLAYACVVGRDPILRLRLRRSAPRLEAVQEIRFRLGAARAEFLAAVTLTAPDRDLVFVEWEVPSALPLIFRSVEGADLRHWSQDSSRLRVWLDRAVRTARLECAGWVALAPEGKGGASRLELPCFRLPAAQAQRTTLRLEATGEQVLETTALHHLTPANGTAAQLTYETKDKDYRLTCLVQDATAGASARILTLATVRGSRLALNTVIDYQPGRGDARAVEVRLGNWGGEEVRLEVPGAVPQRERRTPAGRAWTVPLPPKLAGPVRLTLSGELPLEEADSLLLPEVSVSGVRQAQVYVAVAGKGLGAESKGDLERIDAKALPAWPQEAEQVRDSSAGAWRVTGSQWQLRLRIGRRFSLASPRVFLAEQSAAVVGPGRWMHEMVWWLYHEATTDLAVRLPAPARVVGLAVEGAMSARDAMEQSPSAVDRERLLLRLCGRGGLWRVRLRWLYETPEPLERPDLRPPHLEGVTEDAALWTAWVPPGWEAVSGSAGGPKTDIAERLEQGGAREAMVNLYRADALLELLRLLAEQRQEADLADVQQRFARFCRHAERAVHAGASRVIGSGGRTLGDWLTALRWENLALARRYHFVELLELSEREADAGLAPSEDQVPTLLAMPERGTQVSWHGGPSTPPPRLRLALAGQVRGGAARAAGRWLGLLAVVWLAAMLPFLEGLWRRFWPEPITALGVWGWYLVGPTLVVFVLVLLGASARLVLLGQRVRRLFHRPRRAPSTATPAAAGGS